MLGTLGLTYDEWQILIDFYESRSILSHTLNQVTYVHLLQLCGALPDDQKKVFTSCSNLVHQKFPHKLKQ